MNFPQASKRKKRQGLAGVAGRFRKYLVKEMTELLMSLMRNDLKACRAGISGDSS
jgi:hypothetical protein